MTMQTESDDHLVRYLLGELPEEEAERLDERSVIDEAFALRLREIENDLVDRYARGEPFALERLSQRIQQSAHLQDKVQFAGALNRVTGGSRRTAMSQTAQPASSSRWLRALSAAAVVLLAVAGYLGVRTTQLQGELDRVRSRQDAVQQQNADLQRDLDRARSTPQTPVAPAAFVIPPPRRGVEGETTIVIPSGAEEVVLRLTVESDAYRTFWAALRDPSNRGLWRSADLAATADGANRIVTLTIPTASLRSGRLMVELSGLLADGSVEAAANYPLRVVLE
jgi:hypothetical protein